MDRPPEEHPPGWNPDTDSLEDLVHALFQDEPREPAAPPPQDPGPPRDAAAESRSARPVDPGSAARPSPSRGPVGWWHGRLVTPALAVAAVLTGALAGGHIIMTAAPRPEPAPGPAAAARPTAVPAAPTAVAVSVPAAPQPVVVDFGTRSEVGDGWRLGTSRPYLCDVLMAIPALRRDGTRIVRVTLTLTNRTGTPRPTQAWRLRATADGAPAELVLWPAERFRGVPDLTLAPGASTRFLVAVRLPDRPVRLEITAERDAAPRAVLAGSL